MPEIKICGFTREIEIDRANETLPDYVGFVFAPSRRQVTPERAASLRARLDARILPVGVFTNADAGEIVRLFDAGVIALAQLHGGEDARYIARLKALRGVPVIQAIRAGTSDEPAAAADYLLFDARRGGGGETFDWRAIPQTEKPWFLAGGLFAANLADALELRPFAVDVSSGAETDGVKDSMKMRALIKTARNYGRSDV
ncbi:MAG: phosphoribosylanthranilate isomerase [Oscillospiraceae bacterium]|jgi:phosphoribosylanthranilate isomerase|nr:phosphoribosylanthranilate isomerase [Oscillospiraceae bacterium]